MSSEPCRYPTVEELRAALSIYARESRPPFQNLRQGLREIVRRIYADAPALEEELKRIQKRLGTTDEQAGDMPRVIAIGHKLTNMMWLAILMQGMNKT